METCLGECLKLSQQKQSEGFLERIKKNGKEKVKICKGIPGENSFESIFRKLSQLISDEIFEGYPLEIHGEIFEEISRGISEEISGRVSDKIPKQVCDGIAAKKSFLCTNVLLGFL